MDTVDFIFKRAVKKFRGEVRDDLYDYERYLEKIIEKGGDQGRKAQILLKKVKQKLGESVKKIKKTVVSEVPEENWEQREKKKKEAFKRETLRSINEEFDLD